MIRIVFAIVTVAALNSAPAQGPDVAMEGTFSIVARDPVTGELGAAVQSKAFATGSRAISVKGGVAAIAHQANSNPMYGTLGIELLTTGMTPQQALDMLLRSDEGRDGRQVAILDISGRSAAWSGTGAADWKGHRCGRDFCAQGNILVGAAVVDGIAQSFESSSGPLAERMLAALDAGQAAGGDARGTQAAALIVARPLAAAGFGDRVIDLRVDDSKAPLVELRRLLNMFRSRQLVGDATARLNEGKLVEAAQAAQSAREKSPEFDEAWVIWAVTELRAGRKAAALTALGRAIELNPANKRWLLKNRNLEPLFADPEFRKLIGAP